MLLFSIHRKKICLIPPLQFKNCSMWSLVGSNPKSNNTRRNIRARYQKNHPALTIILELVKNFNNLGNFETKLVQRVPHFLTRRCKQSICTSTSTEQGPEPGHFQISGFLTLFSKKSWNCWITGFPQHKHKDFLYFRYGGKVVLNTLPFLTPVWKTYLPISVSCVRLLSWWMCHSPLKNCKHPKQSYFWVQLARKRLKNVYYKAIYERQVCFACWWYGRSKRL